VIRRLRKVVCKLDDDVLVLLEVLPVPLELDAAFVLACCTGAVISGVIP
jgi:hypothetical protein